MRQTFAGLDHGVVQAGYPPRPALKWAQHQRWLLPRAGSETQTQCPQVCKASPTPSSPFFKPYPSLIHLCHGLFLPWGGPRSQMSWQHHYFLWPVELLRYLLCSFVVTRREGKLLSLDTLFAGQCSSGMKIPVQSHGQGQFSWPEDLASLSNSRTDVIEVLIPWP